MGYFFQTALVSVLQYGCTTWALIKHIEKKLDGNCTRINELYWRNPGCNIQRNNSCTATYLPSLKLSKKDEQGMQDTTGEATTNSKVTFSYGPLHMVVPVLANQQELTSVPYQASLPAGPQGCIPCPHTAYIGKFLLSLSCSCTGVHKRTSLLSSSSRTRAHTHTHTHIYIYILEIIILKQNASYGNRVLRFFLFFRFLLRLSIIQKNNNTY